jgi:hypothetical protein
VPPKPVPPTLVPPKPVPQKPVPHQPVAVELWNKDLRQSRASDDGGADSV